MTIVVQPSVAGVRAPKRSKASVDYRVAENPAASCHFCEHRTGSTCELVDGTVDRIHVCDLFSAAGGPGEDGERSWWKFDAARGKHPRMPGAHDVDGKFPGEQHLPAGPGGWAKATKGPLTEVAHRPLPPVGHVWGTDRTAEYMGRDLHAEGEWHSDPAKARYGTVIFDHQGRVLLREPKGHFAGYTWTFPKGGADKKPDGTMEHPVETARRETIEEIGRNGAIVGHVPGDYKGGDSVNDYYLMHLDDSEHPDWLNGETQTLTWASPEEAEKLIGMNSNETGRERDLWALHAAVNEHAKLYPDVSKPMEPRTQLTVAPTVKFPTGPQPGLVHGTDDEGKPTTQQAPRYGFQMVPSQHREDVKAGGTTGGHVYTNKNFAKSQLLDNHDLWEVDTQGQHFDYVGKGLIAPREDVPAKRLRLVDTNDESRPLPKATWSSAPKPKSPKGMTPEKLALQEQMSALLHEHTSGSVTKGKPPESKANAMLDLWKKRSDDEPAAALSGTRDWASWDAEHAGQSAGDRWRALGDELERRHPGLKLDMAHKGSHISVSRIVVPKDQRNAGTGTAVMGTILDHADREGTPVTLTPDSAFGGSKARLTAWYRNMGFKPNHGRFPESTDSMVRQPHTGTRDWSTFDEARVPKGRPAHEITEQDKAVMTKAHEDASKLPAGKAFHEARPMTDEELKAHRQHVMQVQVAHGSNDLLRSPHSTHNSEDRVGGVEGAYKPERERQHQEIVDAIIARNAGVPNEKKAIVTGGLGGAGKSSSLRRHAAHEGSVAKKLGIEYGSYDAEGHGVGEPTNFLTLNPDDIKEEMAKRGMVPHIGDLSPMESASFIHEESSKITQDLADRAQSQGKNVIWDVTLHSTKSGDSRIDPLRELKDEAHPNGYSVHGLFVDVSPEHSAQNAEARYRRGQDAYNQGKGLGGRYVPSDLILSGHDPSGEYRSKNRAAFESLKAAGKFDRTITIDNEGNAQRVIDETNRTPELVGARAEGEVSMSPLMQRILAARMGLWSRDDMVEFLTSFDYAPTPELHQAEADELDSEDLDRRPPNSWGELRQAANTGLIDRDLYNTVLEAIADDGGTEGAREDPMFSANGKLNGWWKWDLEHKGLAEDFGHHTGGVHDYEASASAASDAQLNKGSVINAVHQHAYEAAHQIGHRVGVKLGSGPEALDSKQISDRSAPLYAAAKKAKDAGDWEEHAKLLGAAHGFKEAARDKAAWEKAHGVEPHQDVPGGKGQKVKASVVKVSAPPSPAQAKDTLLSKTPPGGWSEADKVAPAAVLAKAPKPPTELVTRAQLHTGEKVWAYNNATQTSHVHTVGIHGKDMSGKYATQLISDEGAPDAHWEGFAGNSKVERVVGSTKAFQTGHFHALDQAQGMNLTADEALAKAASAEKTAASTSNSGHQQQMLGAAAGYKEHAANIVTKGSNDAADNADQEKPAVNGLTEPTLFVSQSGHTITIYPDGHSTGKAAGPDDPPGTWTTQTIQSQMTSQGWKKASEQERPTVQASVAYPGNVGEHGSPYIAGSDKDNEYQDAFNAPLPTTLTPEQAQNGYEHFSQMAAEGGNSITSKAHAEGAAAAYKDFLDKHPVGSANPPSYEVQTKYLAGSPKHTAFMTGHDEALEHAQSTGMSAVEAQQKAETIAAASQSLPPGVAKAALEGSVEGHYHHAFNVEHAQPSAKAVAAEHAATGSGPMPVTGLSKGDTFFGGYKVDKVVGPVFGDAGPNTYYVTLTKGAMSTQVTTKAGETIQDAIDKFDAKVGAPTVAPSVTITKLPDVPKTEADLASLTKKSPGEKFANGDTVPSMSYNAGQWYEDSAGHAYLLKQAPSNEAAEAEVAASLAYQQAGIKAQKVTLVKMGNGKLATLSHYEPAVSVVTPDNVTPDDQAQMRQGFGMDALLSHFDVFGEPGNSKGNLLRDANGHIIRIDFGGTGAFKGTGQPKPSSEWHVGDWDELGDQVGPTGSKASYSTMTGSTQGKLAYGTKTFDDVMASPKMQQSLVDASNFDVAKYHQAMLDAGIDPKFAQLQSDVVGSRVQHLKNTLLPKLPNVQTYEPGPVQDFTNPYPPESAEGKDWAAAYEFAHNFSAADNAATTLGYAQSNKDAELNPAPGSMLKTEAGKQGLVAGYTHAAAVKGADVSELLNTTASPAASPSAAPSVAAGGKTKASVMAKNLKVGDRVLWGGQPFTVKQAWKGPVENGSIVLEDDNGKTMIDGGAGLKGTDKLQRLLPSHPKYAKPAAAPGSDRNVTVGGVTMTHDQAVAVKGAMEDDLDASGNPNNIAGNYLNAAGVSNSGLNKMNLPKPFPGADSDAAFLAELQKQLGAGPSAAASTSLPTVEAASALGTESPSVALSTATPPADFAKAFTEAEHWKNFGGTEAMPQQAQTSDEYLATLDAYRVGKNTAIEHSQNGALTTQEAHDRAQAALERRASALMPSEQAKFLGIAHGYQAAAAAKPSATHMATEEELRASPEYAAAAAAATGEMQKQTTTSRDLYAKAGQLSQIGDEAHQAEALAWRDAAQKLDQAENEFPDVAISAGHPEMTAEQIAHMKAQASQGDKTGLGTGGDLEKWAYDVGRSLGITAGNNAYDEPTMTAADVEAEALKHEAAVKTSTGLKQRQEAGIAKGLHRVAEAMHEQKPKITTSAKWDAPKPDVKYHGPGNPNAPHMAGMPPAEVVFTGKDIEAIHAFTGPFRFEVGTSGSSFYASLNRMLIGEPGGSGAGASLARHYLKMVAEKSTPAKQTIQRGTDGGEWKHGQLEKVEAALADGKTVDVSMPLSSCTYNSGTWATKPIRYYIDAGAMTCDIGYKSNHTEFETNTGGLMEIYKIVHEDGKTKIYMRQKVAYGQ